MKKVLSKKLALFCAALLIFSCSDFEEINEIDLTNIIDVIQDPTQEMQEAMEIISSLEPRPGRPFFARDSERYIVPDFYVYNVGGELQIQLNRDFPRVRISNYYKNLIKKDIYHGNSNTKC